MVRQVQKKAFNLIFGDLPYNFVQTRYMGYKEQTTLIYSKLAQNVQKIVRTNEINLNLMFMGLLKWTTIGFSSIWYNDEKTPNYLGLIVLLFWYSFCNQFIKYWKKNHKTSLNEQFCQKFLQVLTRLGLARFISETFQIHYFHESLIIIVAALVVQILQFFLKKQFKSKDKLVHFLQYQWVLIMQIFTFMHYLCVKIQISFLFTTPVIEYFLFIHFCWLIHLAYQFLVNIKSKWHLKQKRRQYQRALMVILSILYTVLFAYISQTHFSSGIGIRLQTQIICGIITASYLAKKTIQKKLNNMIKFQTINLSLVSYTIATIFALTYSIYWRGGQQARQAANFFKMTTVLLVFVVSNTFWESYIVGKRLIRWEQIHQKPQSQF